MKTMSDQTSAPMFADSHDPADVASHLAEDGYAVLKGFFDRSSLQEFERSIVQSYCMQALKIGATADQLGKDRSLDSFTGVEDLDRAVLALEAEDTVAGYNAMKIVDNSVNARRFAADRKLCALASALLDCPEGLLTVAGPQPFINVPTNKRLLYRWHKESHFLPKRENFLNIWFPLFRPKGENNGTMTVKPGSHRAKLDKFIEYKGYDRETMGKAQHFAQFDIPEYMIEEFETVFIIAEPGDIVVFVPSLVHGSNINQSNEISYTGVMRIFDYRADLTLSGDPMTRPYTGEDYGRPDLRPLTTSRSNAR